MHHQHFYAIVAIGLVALACQSNGKPVRDTDKVESWAKSLYVPADPVLSGVVSADADYCGNGFVGDGEQCDGDCPSVCDDADPCTNDRLVGSAGDCDAVCSYAKVRTCSQDRVVASHAPPTGVTLDCNDESTWPQAWVDLEAEIFAESNRRRADPRGQFCGMVHYDPQPPLEFDPRLRNAARCHLMDLTANDAFSHSGSDGSRVGIRTDRTRYHWQFVGENLAAGNGIAKKIVDQWIASPTHCENLMKGEYEELGIAYVHVPGTRYTDYQAQVFGKEFSILRDTEERVAAR